MAGVIQDQVKLRVASEDDAQFASDLEAAYNDLENATRGRSAYQVWLDAGNTGTEADYLASLKGEAGDAGPAGPQGAAGADGADGAQGVAGPKGDRGEGLASRGVLSGASTALPSSPAEGDLYFLASPVPSAAPDPADRDAEAGDAIVYDGSAWINIGRLGTEAGEIASVAPPEVPSSIVAYRRERFVEVRVTLGGGTVTSVEIQRSDDDGASWSETYTLDAPGSGVAVLRAPVADVDDNHVWRSRAVQSGDPNRQSAYSATATTTDPPAPPLPSGATAMDLSSGGGTAFTDTPSSPQDSGFRANGPKGLIAVAFRPDVLGGNQIIFGADAGDDRAYLATAGTSLGAGIGTTSLDQLVGGALQNGTWAYGEITWDGTNARLYLNGVLLVTRSAPDAHDTLTLWAGARNRGGSQDIRFTGLIGYAVEADDPSDRAAVRAHIYHQMAAVGVSLP